MHGYIECWASHQLQAGSFCRLTQKWQPCVNDIIGIFGDGSPDRQTACDILVDMIHAFKGQRAIIPDPGDGGESRVPVDLAPAGNAPIGLGDMDITQIGCCSAEA